MRDPRFLACIAFLCIGSTARADVASAIPGLHLTWSAPAGCPTGADVAADVGRILRSTSSAAPRALQADGRVSRRGDRWHLSLTTTGADGSGERALDAPTCRAIADAAALIVALAIDPSAAALATPAASATATPAGAVPPSDASAPTSPASPSVATPASAPASAAEPAPPATGPASRALATDPRAQSRESPSTRTVRTDPARHRLLAGLAGAGNIGDLPSLGAGAAVVVGWTPGPLRTELFGDAWLGQSSALASRPGVGGNLQELGLGARGCANFVLTSAVEVGPCAGLRIASMAGSGFGARTTFSGSAVWAEVIAGTFGTVRIAGPFSARITVEALVPLKRPTFVVLHDGVVETLHRPATLGGKGTLGIEARFF